MPHTLQQSDHRAMIQDIINDYIKYGNTEEVKKIQEAYEFAEKAHQESIRKS